MLERKNLNYFVHDRMEVNLMQTNSFKKAIEAQFDCLTKRAVNGERSKYYAYISKYWTNEVLFSSLSKMKLEGFADVEN